MEGRSKVAFERLYPSVLEETVDFIHAGGITYTLHGLIE